MSSAAPPIAPAPAPGARLADREADRPAVAARLRTAGIAGVGTALPAQVVGNAPIAERLGVGEDWIVSRTGIHRRHCAAPADTLTALASRAAADALRRAGVDPADLDLVLVATFTQDDLLPNTAPLVAHEIGARRAGALDLGAACTGFLSGLALACGQVEAGRADAVLLVGADLPTRFLDRDDRRTAALFGDGAGAAVVTAGSPGRVGPIVLRADGAGADLITIARCDAVIRMRGQDTFRAAVAHMCESTLEAVAAAGVGPDEIDLYVYHQANGRILAAVGERLGLPAQRVVDCIAGYGNTSAASIPIALAEARDAGLLAPGARVLVSALGSGLTWGAGVIEWG